MGHVRFSQNILALSVLTLTSIPWAKAANKVVNAPEYMALCRLYRIANQGQKLNEEVWVKERLPTPLPEKLLNEVEGLFGRLNISGESKKIVDLDDNEIILKGSPLLMKQTDRVGQLMAAMGNLARSGDSLISAAKSELGNAKASFLKATRGDWPSGDSIEASKLSAKTREQFCKRDGGGSAGENLIVDLTCLCGTLVTSSTEHLCGFHAATSMNHVWRASTGEHEPFNNNWAKIKTDCERQREPPLTPWDINQSLYIFESLIGRQAAEKGSGAGETRYMLGRPHSDGTCAGSNADTGCVNYGGTTPKSEKRELTQWENELYTASNRLNVAARKLSELHTIAVRMLHLRDLAQAVFNETILEARLGGINKAGSGESPPEEAKLDRTNPSQTSSVSPLTQKEATTAFRRGSIVLFLAFASTP